MTNKERREKKQRNKREIKKTYREWLATQPPAIALYKQKEKGRVKEYESKFY